MWGKPSKNVKILKCQQVIVIILNKYGSNTTAGKTHMKGPKGGKIGKQRGHRKNRNYSHARRPKRVNADNDRGRAGVHGRGNNLAKR